jgi:4-hydroxy-tetrahydrodipicolinate synthase
VNTVVGTTGWRSISIASKRAVEKHGVGLVWSPNYSVGMNVFFRLVSQAARLLASEPEYGAWGWEIHHSTKKDAPSGTLLKLVEEMRRAGYQRPVDTASNRAGAHPGTHEIGFDSAADTITLRHVARGREGFARGALKAAQLGGGQARDLRVQSDFVRLRAGGRKDMFTGCGTALVTPFKQDGSLDEAALRRLVRRQIEEGIDFLAPCGTTGESPTLSRQEHLRVVEITLEEAKGKVPVVAGAGGYNTAEVIALAKELEAMGVDGLLSVTPYYNKPTQEGLYQHYRAIAGAVRLPIIVYSVQGRTGVNVEPLTLKRLAAIDNIVAVKEASGNIGQMASIVHHVPERFHVLSGDDAITIPLIALGGKGIISVASNEIPGPMTRLTRAALDGDFAAARALQRKYLPLMEVNFIESNPIPVKAAMAMMGLLEPVWRLPLVPPQPHNQEKIRKVLEDAGLLGAPHAG